MTPGGAFDSGVNRIGNLERWVLWEFDPVIRKSGHYRRSLSVINGLLCFVFVVAGAVAFYFDNVTLPGRTELAEFSGKWAYALGVASFFIADYWIYQSVREHRVSLLALLAPFFTATAASEILLAIKYR